MSLFESWSAFRDPKMARRDNLHKMQAALLNWLLLILIFLMIVSLFSVLLIKGVLLKDRQVNVQPSRALAAACCDLPFSGPKS